MSVAVRSGVGHPVLKRVVPSQSHSFTHARTPATDDLLGAAALLMGEMEAGSLGTADGLRPVRELTLLLHERAICAVLCCVIDL